jgi:hypothetical protein
MTAIRPTSGVPIPPSPGAGGEPPPAAGPDTPAAESGAGPAPGSLWDVLTPEEREFFAVRQTLGPITYRPARAGSDPAAPTGRRVDVRG